MTDQHPITPPRELMQQWREQAPRYHNSNAGREERLMERAAQWGYDQRGEVNEAKLQQARDQELEACCDWLRHEYEYGEELALKLRADRRPKPPSLKGQALHALGSPIMIGESQLIGHRDHDLLRRALEALPDD